MYLLLFLWCMSMSYISVVAYSVFCKIGSGFSAKSVLTGGLSVISVAISVMYVHGLYFCCCIFCFLQNNFRIFCIICAYRGLIVIFVSVSVSVLYVHGLYLFCCIFCFLQNRSLFPCIYAYKVVMCLYMYFPFIKYLL